MDGQSLDIKQNHIDPPYNTGNDHFIYPDRFSESKEEYLKRVGEKDEEGYLTREGLFRANSKDSGHYHSNWMNMMYPRLFLARNLLKDDGVIFVSIADNEVQNLRMLMNEVYGEENFVDCIIWEKRYGGGAKEKHLVTLHEYVLFYAKNIESIENIYIPLDEESIIRYYKSKSQHQTVVKFGPKDNGGGIKIELGRLLKIMSEAIVKEIIAIKPEKCIALDKLFADNDQLKTNTVLQMKDAGIEFKTI